MRRQRVSGASGSIPTTDFSATRLPQIASHLAFKATSKCASTLDGTITAALRHLYVLRPTSSTSLLNRLRAISHIASPRHIHPKPRPDRSLALLILDSATAFTYQDRFDADIARLEAGPGAEHLHAPTPTTPSRTSQIIAALRQIQHDFECTIVFTTSPAPSSAS